MESSRQLDAPRSAAAIRPLKAAAGVTLLLLLLCCSRPGFGQATPKAEHQSSIQQLFDQQRWEEVVRLAEGVPDRSAELNYCYGVALARLGQFDAARQALLAGERQAPREKRFPTELGGIAFKQRRYPEATRWLRRALQLDPEDAYLNDFLASVYFLQENLEAALKYWNRAGKPQIENVRVDSELRIDPVLLDRAFAFAPASTLRLPDLLTSETRVRGLEIFPHYRFDLSAREDGKFDVLFRAQERNGWGNNKWEGLLSLFRGIFQQTLQPELFNLERSAVNVVSMVRWDAEKRRVAASVSSPWKRDAKWRYRLGLDLRNENWDVRDSSSGQAPLLGALNLRRESVSVGIASFASGRWRWGTGVEFSHRDFRRVLLGSALTTPPLSQGYQLKHLAELEYELWRLPEHRFLLSAGGSSETGRIWSQPAHLFLKLENSLAAHCFPQARGDDYEIEERVRAGTTFGAVPFDELFMLGVERDNDLWLRAHPGTRAGRKGSAPLGRHYFLSNWEMDKNVYRNGVFTVKLGPFFDVGRITDPEPGLGSREWLWDTGAQTKVRVLGVGVVLLYGKDLRTGRNTFYATVRR